MRMRGLPLDAKNTHVDSILSGYGSVVVGTSYSTWRNTAIKTGERTLKIKLERDIPGRIRTKEYSWITLRYRDQPDLCFHCVLAGHQQWECDEVRGKSYSSAVQGVEGATATPTPTHRIPTGGFILWKGLGRNLPQRRRSRRRERERKGKERKRRNER